MPLRPDLRVALDLIAAKCAVKDATLRCVARPEMYTNGKPLEWLRGKLPGVTDHLNLSDGTSLKLIPHFRNHLFAYGLQSSHRLASFKMLMRRAPELLSQYETQVNSVHCVSEHKNVAPASAQAVMPDAAIPPTVVWMYAFYCNPHSVEDSVNQMLSWGELERNNLDSLGKVTYVPLTEVATKDLSFQSTLAKSIVTTYFDQGICLLIRLPSPGLDLPSRLKMGLEGIRSVGLHLPRARATNIFFLADDLSERTMTSAGSQLSLVIHESFEYWRYTQSLYRAAAQISFHHYRSARLMRETKNLLTECFGQVPVLVPGSLHGEEMFAAEVLE